MDVFSLVAKLTLDTEEYTKALKQAESQGDNAVDIEAELKLNASDFQNKIDEAQDSADDLEMPDDLSLDLDNEDFISSVDDAQKSADDLDVPDDLSLDLENNDFNSSVDESQTKVDDLEVPDDLSLTLDTSEFSDAVDDVDDKTSSLSDSMGSSFDGIKSMIASAGVAAAIVGIAEALGDCIDLARSLGDNIDKSSRAMGVSTDFYQEWTHVLEINGAEISVFNRGLMNMQKLMAGDDVSADFAEGLDKLGLSAKVANGEITTTEELLESAVRALADWDTSTDKGRSDRDLIAQQLFGRGGTKLNALFDGTSEDIDFLIKQAHELGAVMSPEEVANAASYNDAVTNLQTALTGLKTAFISDIIPVLTDAVNGLTNLITLFNPRNRTVPLVEMFDQIDTQLAASLLDINATSKAASDMVEELLSMGDASKLSAEEQQKWKGIAKWLIDNIPSLKDVIDLETMTIKGNSDEISNNINEWKNYAIEKAKAEALAKKQEALQKRTTEWLEKETQVAEAQAEYAKANQALMEVEQRIFKGMSEGDQQRFLSRYKYGSAEEIDWSEGSVIYGQLYNQLHPATATDLGNYGTREFLDVSQAQYTASNNLTKLTEEAQWLKEDVETGNKTLLEYSNYLQEVLDSLFGTSEDADTAAESVENLNDALDNLPDSKNVSVNVDYNYPDAMGSHWTRHAIGAWDVPYDDYPILAHRGERLLTATQARQSDNGMIGNTSEIVGAISGLRNDLKQLQLVVNGKTFGRAVVDYGGNRVDNYLGSADSKAASGYGA